MTTPVKLEVGEAAPLFTIDTPDGEVALSDLIENAEKGVIVYFYPKVNTPGCTTEACDFRDNLNSLKSAGYSVIGISADSIPALKKFAEKQSLNFILGSDSDHEVMTRWGVWGAKKAFGKSFLGINRSTFVVDKEGNLSVVEYSVKATGHVARLRKTLGIDQ